jgi:hypothetical protein
MVEFYDPLIDKNISYHIAPALLKIWSKLRDGGLEKLNEDRIYLVDGREGTGKSSFTFQQAKYINPTFDVPSICFSPRQFLELLRNAPKGSVIVFDEAFRGLSSKGSRSKINKDIVEALMEVRQRNLVIFIVLPTIFLLEIYAAVFRSESLLHVYKLKKRNSLGQKKRGFKIYNYQNKKTLYLRGRAKYFSYSRPRITKAKGEFYVKKNDTYPTGIPYESFNLQAYLKKKDEAFKKKEEDVSDAEAKYKQQRDLIIKGMYKDKIKSLRKLSTWLEAIGVGMTPRQIGNIVGESSENTEL